MTAGSDPSLCEKKRRLEDILRQAGSIAVAYSAGVDSTFLLDTARRVLGDNVLAVTVRSYFCPDEEIEQAVEFCGRGGIAHVVAECDPLADGYIRHNPPDRCYRCKKLIFSDIIRIASEHGINSVAEGSNLDDLDDYRPGMRAVSELGVSSPLREARLTKRDIRQLSREAGLYTWDKPSYACLASRFPYGDELTPGKLLTVGKAEKKLHDMGFAQVRVRHHGDVARIEVEKESFARVIQPDTAAEIVGYLLGLGYRYAALDLAGYTTGSMNIALKDSIVDKDKH